MKSIELYYDYRSPFAYFASQRLDLFQGTPIHWKPVSVSGLINLQVDRDPRSEVVDPLCPAKRNHFMADIFRLIGYWKIPFAPPNPTPPICNTAMAISAKLAADGVEHDAFRSAIFASVWQKQQDAESEAVLRECLEGANLDPDLARTATQEGEEILFANTQLAFKKGVFGTPSFIYNDELYFGADRMELLAASLNV